VASRPEPAAVTNTPDQPKLCAMRSADRVAMAFITRAAAPNQPSACPSRAAGAVSATRVAVATQNKVKLIP
jgi:hypothetical protein